MRRSVLLVLALTLVLAGALACSDKTNGAAVPGNPTGEPAGNSTTTTSKGTSSSRTTSGGTSPPPATTGAPSPTAPPSTAPPTTATPPANALARTAEIPTGGGKVFPDQKVVVTGQVRPFVEADLDRDFDWFDNGKLVDVKTKVDWKTRPVIVADSIRTDTGTDIVQR